MKKLLLFFVLCGIIFLAILCKPGESDLSKIPPPTNGTEVKMDMEDRPKRAAKQKWFDLMHQAEEGVDWKLIEFENNIKQAAYKRSLRNGKNASDSRSSEVVAEGRLEGTWVERGSNNQAGSMLTVNYIPEDDNLVGISAGGTLWKGDRTGFNWEVVNQDFRFGSDLVAANYLDDGTLRYVTGLNNQAVYSDDGGNSWTPSEGMDALGGAALYDYVETSDGTMYVLHKDRNIFDLQAYQSKDHGKTWEVVYTFPAKAKRNLALTKAHNSDMLIAIEQINTNLTNVYLWDAEEETFYLHKEDSPVGFGSETDANLNATYAEDSLRLYVRNHENKLFISTDSARTWREKSTLPTEPWSVGIYVSSSDHTKILYGEVNPYRSATEGKFWNKLSNWWEYYDDIFSKLHADVMDIKEFVDNEGNPFIVVCNHGGVSQTYDHGENFENIGLYSLNISQYYSVATHPTDREYVFAGAQDQGFQRGKVIQDETISFDQVISGDYGHIVFSGEDDNMWTVYPWGSVSYYDNPIIQGPTSGWTLESETESVWIPPLLGHPDKSQNAIFMAGGNIDGGPGSRLIRLDVGPDNEIIPSQFDFNFRQSGGEVSAIGISHINNDIIHVATTNGVVYKSTDGGQTFEEKGFNLPGSHWLYGSCIKPSKIDINRVYLSGSGYSLPPVHVSYDGGETYTPMSEGLPNTMVFSVEPNEDESLIFAATEAGPYVYITEEERWFDLSGAGTPNQTYWSVEYLEDTKTARFGTYGRGIWDFQFEGIITSIEENSIAKNDIKVYPNPADNYIIVDTEKDLFGTISVSDQQGRVLSWRNDQKLAQTKIDLSTFNSGIYFVTIISENNSVTKKIVKQ